LDLKIILTSPKTSTVFDKLPTGTTPSEMPRDLPIIFSIIADVDNLKCKKTFLKVATRILRESNFFFEGEGPFNSQISIFSWHPA